MSFADKLFSNGTVLPLELPPRLRGRTRTPTGSSPGSAFKTWQNLWRTDFDPFVTALEKVRMEEKRGRRWESFGRRARSLSPLRGNYGGSEEDPDGLRSSLLLNQGEKKSIDHLGPLEDQVATKLAQPRGLEFARRVRLVELKQNGNIDNKGKEKSQIMKKKLLMSRSKSSEVERSGEQNTESSAMAARKRSFLRRLSFKSSRSAQLMEKKKTTSEMVKFKMDFLRPKTSLLCLGYGIRTNS